MPQTIGHEMSGTVAEVGAGIIGVSASLEAEGSAGEKEDTSLGRFLDCLSLAIRGSPGVVFP